MELDVKVARKLLDVVDAGLCAGVGQPIPGQMCVEAAVCYALDLPHGDDPKCVSRAVRAFKIRLNDSSWSSNEARAKGMRKLAVAQLGSDGIDDVAFSTKLAKATIQKLLPYFFRKHFPGKFVNEVDACEKLGTRNSAWALRTAAAADAAAYAADAAAYAAAAAAADAAAYAAAAYAAADSILSFSSDLAFNILREMNAPGVKLWEELHETR